MATTDTCRCDEVADWVSPEETHWFAVMGHHSIDDLDAILRREKFPDELVVAGARLRTGHWRVAREGRAWDDAVDDFGLTFDDSTDPDEGCDFTFAHCVWEG